ncbi:MAG: sigma-70 family RNA polymerase sigma factor [Bacteroidota bacterium]
MTDQEIMINIAKPEMNRQAFNTILEKYQRKIYWHIRKMVINHDDADDVTQETFIKVWTHLDSYRGEAQLYTWIYRVATNECLNFLAKKKKHLSVDISGFQDLLSDHENNPLVDGDAIQIKLQKALLTLPDKQRLVFNMKYFDEMPYNAISKITGTSEGALKASYHFAVKKIEDFLNKD